MAEEKLRWIAYNRVSTPEQAREGYNLAEYEARMRSYCARKGWELVEVYTDEGKSARTVKNRQQYLAMVERLETDDSIDGIIVYKIDRVHRNLRNALRFFDELDKKSGKQFVSIMENFDTSTAMGKAMLQITLVFAELESAQTGERIKMSTAKSIEKGIHQGHVNPDWWSIVRGHPEAARRVPGAAGLIAPNEKLLAMGEDRDNGMSWMDLSHKYGPYRTSCTRAFTELKKWREDPVHGFILAPNSKVVVPRSTSHKHTLEAKEKQRQAGQVILNEMAHLKKTGELRYPTMEALAKACRYSTSTLYEYSKSGLFDLSYRKGGSRRLRP